MRPLGACVYTAYSRTVSDDRGNVALERICKRMPEPMEHHRDESEAVGPIPTPCSYAYIVACDHGEIAILQISGGHEVETKMVLTHL